MASLGSRLSNAVWGQVVYFDFLRGKLDTWQDYFGLIKFPGTIYHVIARGPFLRKMTVFTAIPRLQRFALRLSPDTHFPERQSKPSRNKAIAAAHIDHGCSRQSITAHLGLHYATVSGIIKKERNTSNSKT
ncbi:hypothetical protein [Desulfonatronum sp. SC1]|uniref:hypothetical protein n=1 Tax=Desulfonatronum sp. SC1 TaxID=2109626 RepID=UPI000D30C8C7|nr:hypothetical protein [Desulfonatronum sp. SC1]PTN32857.1 hypothetical protein C6366_15515 [Desulfonatronum sp. SC1]